MPQVDPLATPPRTPRAAVDFVNEAADLHKHEVPFTLHPTSLGNTDFSVPQLVWDSIPYGHAQISSVPDDKRGIYAFAIHQPSAVLPPHTYVLYIGLAGRNSERSLRSRYRDYLSEAKYMKRPRIARMIGTWYNVLKFFYAPVDHRLSSQDLLALEKELIAALLPPFCAGDLESSVAAKQRAFR